MDARLQEYLTKRGISEELAAVRDYHPWEPETGSAVIEEFFVGLHESGLRWLQSVASNPDNDGGFVISRRPVMSNSPAIFPEIKTWEAVGKGITRHFHGHIDTLFELLPTQVEWAMAVPKMGFLRLYFQHNHEMLEKSDHRHIGKWHGQRVPTDSHRHSLMVFDPDDATDHVHSKGERYSHAHHGEPSNEVHAHAESAKYLFPPNQPVDASWDIKHEHDGMSQRDLDRHLTTHHREEL